MSEWLGSGISTEKTHQTWWFTLPSVINMWLENTTIYFPCLIFSIQLNLHRSIGAIGSKSTTLGFLTLEFLSCFMQCGAPKRYKSIDNPI